jgi:1-acyl-sn-glycerol-3-phosphate acyltransferase
MTLLRSAAFAAWFYGLTIFMLLVSPVVRVGPRTWALRYARLWARLILFGLRVLCGITWELTGSEHLPAEGPALIASMHQSAFDTVFWVHLLPNFTYVLKRELTHIPLFGALLRRGGMISVDRSAGGVAIRGLLRDAARAVADRRAIIIFPEGTRVAPGVQVALQPGVAAVAARTGLPVIPVATDSGLRWGRRAFRKQPGVIHVSVLPPIGPGLARDALMSQLAEAFSCGAARFAQAVDNPVG